MKVKTADLIGPALDWAVAKIDQPQWSDDDCRLWVQDYEYQYSPSTNWSQGGPIIEQEGINIFKHNKLDESLPDVWCAHKVVPRPNMEGSFNSCALAIDGPTPLIAAMRCFVASRLGDEVDVPGGIAMSSTLDSDVLTAEYEDEIRSWDWKMIIKWFDNHGDSPDYYEDDGDGNRFVYQWIGTVFGLTPSGKVYAFWTTNQTDEDVIRDSAWWEALEVVADEHGCFVGLPDGCGGADIFLCKRFDTPEEDDEDDDSFS